MKRRNQFPVDLLTLLLVPVFTLTVIAAVAGCAVPFYNWLMAHR